MIRPVAILLLATSLASAAVSADTASLTYDRIHISASAEELVENDTIEAVLFAQAQSHDLARASDAVNRQIAAGMQAAKLHNAVKAQTLEYRTIPVYQAGKPTGEWQVQQAMRLESQDSRVLSRLLGELQESLALRSIGYQLSVEARKRVEDRLIERAIEAFRSRAQRIADIWGRSGYRLVEAHLSENGGAQPNQRIQAAEMSAIRAAPALEAGEQRITVTLQGSIELHN